MLARSAWRNGPRGKNIAIYPSLWIRSRSPRLANTSKSSRATAQSTGSFTVQRMNSPKPAPAAKNINASRLSVKAEQFTESVIREMTRLALQYGAVNLSQGFPDFPAPAEIKRAAQEAISADINQYAITWGAKSLRDAVARQMQLWQGIPVDPEREITVCCGSTETMISALLAVFKVGE